MRGYLTLFGARFRALLQYRAAAVAGLGTQFFWGLIRIMIFEAFYRSTATQQPMTLGEVVSYVWLSQAMFHLIPFRMDRETVAKIRDGSVAYELARPLDLYWTWYSRDLATRTAPTILRALPMIAITAAFFGLDLPSSWASLGSFLAALTGAVLLSTAITTLVSVTVMWTMSAYGVSSILLIAVMLFSGSYIPLPLFPDWAQGILNALPFRGVVDVPFRLWSGNIPPEQAPLLVAQQLAWTVALVAVGRLLMRRGTRRLVIQGG